MDRKQIIRDTIVNKIKDYMFELGMYTIKNNTNNFVYSNIQPGNPLKVPYDQQHVLSFNLIQIGDDDKWRLTCVCDGFHIDVLFLKKEIAEETIERVKGILEYEDCFTLTKLERNAKLNKIL